MLFSERMFLVEHIAYDVPHVGIDPESQLYDLSHEWGHHFRFITPLKI